MKNEFYSKTDFSSAEKYFESFSKKQKKSLYIPSYKKINELYSTQILDELLKVKGFAENAPNKKASNLIKLSYLSLAGTYSTRVKDGNGLKIKKNYSPPNSILPFFKEHLRTFLFDLKETSKLTKKFQPRLYNGTINEIERQLLAKTSGQPSGAIFSPPYPNCFDYLEVYKIELWMGEFINSFKDLRPLRNKMIRSAVNCMFDTQVRHELPEVRHLSQLIAQDGIWNDRIPLMILGYFDDMSEVLKILKNSLLENSPVYIVVANSCYKSVVIPTDLILARIAETLGYNVDGIESVRQIRASSQQMKILGGKTDLMRESIIKLRT